MKAVKAKGLESFFFFFFSFSTAAFSYRLARHLALRSLPPTAPCFAQVRSPIALFLYMQRGSYFYLEENARPLPRVPVRERGRDGGERGRRVVVVQAMVVGEKLTEAALAE